MTATAKRLSPWRNATSVRSHGHRSMANILQCYRTDYLLPREALWRCWRLCAGRFKTRNRLALRRRQSAGIRFDFLTVRRSVRAGAFVASGAKQKGSRMDKEASRHYRGFGSGGSQQCPIDASRVQGTLMAKNFNAHVVIFSLAVVSHGPDCERMSFDQGNFDLLLDAAVLWGWWA